MSEARISYVNRMAYIHDLALDAGLRYKYNSLLQDAGAAQNSATDEFKDLNSGKADEKSVDGHEERWSWLNYYLTAKYILNDRYIFTANLTMDASSRFGPEVEEGISIAGHPFALFPSAGAAWRLSSESFMEGLTFLDELKLRLSYGLVGSDEFVNYYTRLYYSTVPYYSITGFALNGMHNPGIKWEQVKKGNAGLDLALFRERLVLNADYYSAVTEDMITYITLPSYYGFGSYINNEGSCENKGMELGIYGKILDGSLRWEVDANYSLNRNQVLSIPGGQIITAFEGGEKISMTGYPMGQFYGYRSLGVLASQDEADAANLVDKSGRRFKAGDLQFDDLDGNGVIDELDKTVIGDPHPDFMASLYNQFTFKGISLSFLLYYVQGIDLFNYVRSQMESMSGFDNQTTAVYNRWVSDGQVTDIPRASYGDPMGNNRFSSRWIEDGTYLRLSSLTLSYTFPRELAFFNKLHIYVTGTNLFTYTSYLGYDPEFSYMDGVLGQGIDYGQIPQPRTVVIGIKVGL
jgi:TonB-linked SusC/RagA family outer membrane protein